MFLLRFEREIEYGHSWQQGGALKALGEHLHKRARAAWLRVRPIIPRYRRNPLVRIISRGCELWLKAYENCNGAHESNGEELVLRRLAACDVGMIFDVGANYGGWALMARRYFPNAVIHCFELSAPTFQSLLEHTANTSIVAHNVGLADREGETSYFHYPHLPGETSLLALPGMSGATVMAGQLTTGDQVCQQLGIPAIDILKIDVEGMESAVLAGFQRMLASGSIAAIQFEYQFVNPVTRFLLKNFYDLLEPHGYCVGKIFPSYVEFRPYAPVQEMQYGSNYLAVLRSRSDLLSALQA